MKKKLYKNTIVTIFIIFFFFFCRADPTRQQDFLNSLSEQVVVARNLTLPQLNTSLFHKFRCRSQNKIYILNYAVVESGKGGIHCCTWPSHCLPASFFCILHSPEKCERYCIPSSTIMMKQQKKKKTGNGCSCRR